MASRRKRSGIELVPKEHWKHVIMQAEITEEHQMMLWRLAASNDPAALPTLVQEINSHLPGTTERLEQLYDFGGQRTLHLWTVPALQEMKPAELKALLERRLKVAIEEQETVTLPKKKGTKPQVRQVTLHKDRLDVQVRLKKERLRTLDDEPHSDWADKDVNLRINLKRKDRLTQGYAEYADARRALMIFLRWLLRKEIPEKAGAQQAAFFTHFRFNEGDVHRAMLALGGERFTQRADDPRGHQGKIQVWAKPRDGTSLYKAMDETDPLVVGQEALPKDLKGIQFVVVHAEDGYQEAAQVYFGFSERQPRIVFLRRASRTTVSLLLDTLMRAVAGG